MGKISKNLKKIRSEKNITQETLANQIHTTRQTISNWENDKCQPDLESLKLIAEALEVDLEELIYGTKNNIGTEPANDRLNLKIRIVLGILGSSLAVIGLTLIFVNFWQKFPMILKTVLSIVPMLAGQGFALLVYLRKKESTLLRECSSVAWCIGIISTVALVNSVYNIHCGYENCLLIDIILCAPIFFLMNSVTPLAIFYFMSVNLTAITDRIFITSAFLILGIIFTLKLRKSRQEHPEKYTLALSFSIAASVFHLLFFIFKFQIAPIYCVTAYLIFLYAVSDKENPFSTPARIISVIGTIALMTLRSSIAFPHSDFDFTNVPLKTGVFIISALLIGAGIFFGRKTYKNNAFKTALTAVPALSLFTAFFEFDAQDPAVLIMLAFSCLYGLILIIKGTSDRKLSVINAGFVQCFLQILNILAIFEADMLIIGITLLLFGIAFIAVNAGMTLHKKALNEREGTLNV